MTRPIGILGGTFDPVHHGHLRMAIEVRDLLGLEEVRFVPLHIPPHRTPPVASGQHRLHMLKLAVNDIAGLSVDEREIRRDAISYTIHTARSLREEFPGQPLCLLLGEDAFRSFDSWREWDKLTDYVHIIIASRDGNDANAYPEPLQVFYDARHSADPQHLASRASGAIYRALIPVLDISSTRIRALIAGEGNAEFLLPAAVLDYIHQQQLYR